MGPHLRAMLNSAGEVGDGANPNPNQATELTLALTLKSPACRDLQRNCGLNIFKVTV